METCRNLLGIPVNHIFPVKNYHEEMDTDDDMDAVILKALDQIVSVACDALRKKTSLTSDLPQVIIMTKVDEACPLVKEDLRKVYTSKKIKEKMQECSNLLGIPLSNIFPVKNYHEEVDKNDDMDVLILKALDQIVNLANDALENQNPSEKSE
ncbi:interferon-induced protein 44-like [Ictalurus furcatus]|uniref:interferon-induced protein 44-like n=1 Tax=Ictalurus furcatus TaxID=66913 RepID=UPI00234FF07A|nr:interferon-induced protein 44-like [Ictalurus furcatus]XP_053472187.1 interferon-induced protein 44-like [Ictalurus furcatus]XP_053472188.1 interferon-induced protein 44-like [Ictalurus furcatus]XP_053472190.1 interferon-induced protein 44-like [Ictalurus furcatus]XP_053472191.1 interferon-induced protein 44-like [Ictalurus furcatus]XP_053472192.1 interferon-induced protein 44-like [Ictalurus furcatus]XP_053472193.1 interferon-induced protein 44-like [Ictalurus furcatus]XP_053472194.1 int